ncbi:hypothetical protein UFOVP736_24 [uncultured Caudovirales phage]|uniref:Uncharacterized protein n=1 Tax=uncultured Caudovirales phage TaxID=2100421 RepID=A0A6J7X3X0_9CAUD|nr:hypothetical protein UFOVP705_57 [uncultured Caudovirales phage]CAB5223987.1 hypothetical protein UFOVP736_24 [uncultured Caudovirales phage]
MSFTQHGNGDYEFGFNDPDALLIAAAVGVKPQTLSLAYTPEFTASAENENGETESVVVGEDMVDFTLSGYLVDKDLFEDGLSFEFDGRYFIVMGRKRDLSNKEFVKAELTGKSHKLVTGLAV